MELATPFSPKAEGYRNTRFYNLFTNFHGEPKMTINPNQLKAELKQFTGTEQFYKNPLFPNYVYTDGIKYLAETAGAYWLIDYVLSNQLNLSIKNEPFQVWKIKVKDNSAIIRVEDGDKHLVKQFKLGFTDFPLDEITIWLTDRTLLLPSEY